MELICRICLKTTSASNNIFDNNLPQKIEIISSIQVFPTDNLPHNLCFFCEKNVNLLYDFRNQIIKNNAILSKRLQQTHEVLIKREEFFSTPIQEISNTNFCDETENVNKQVSNEDKPDVEEDENVKINSSKSHEKVPITKIITSVKTYKCNFCDFETKIFGELKRHKRNHIVTEMALCNICGKLVTKGNLSKHLIIHSDNEVTCKVCGKVLKNMTSLRGHMEVHNRRKFECKMCDKVYNNRTAMSHHLQWHALGGKPTYECSVCKKLFTQGQTLKSHARTHTGERPYPCTYCKKGFSSTNALKVHTRQHTNEKPYVCRYCNRAFPQRVSLRTHLKSKHPHEPTYTF